MGSDRCGTLACKAVATGLALMWVTAILGTATAQSVPPPLPGPSPGARAAAVIDPAVEERFKRQDDVIRQLLDQNRKLSDQLQNVTRRLDGATVPAANTSAARTGDGSPPRTDTSNEGGAGARDNPPERELDPGSNRPAPADGSPPRSDSSREGGAGARDNPPETVPTPGRPLAKLPAKVSIGPGFVVETEDEEFQLQFHDQTQIESRIYQQGGMKPVASGFWVPRERLIFNGRLTKPIEYEGSVEAAYGTLNLLNAFITWHPDDRFLLKGGRFKVPFGYEYYAISNVDLLQPERSLFGTNFGFNRMPGGMAYGQLLDKRLDYAAGIFNGPRNQTVEYNSDKDFIAYLNARPFEKSESLPFLHFLNMGGSVDTGSQNNPVVPQALRTSVSQTANSNLALVAPAWLNFNNNVTETGQRTLWSLHLAYYYKGFSLYGEWQSGFTDYAKLNSPNKTHLPIDGWYLASGYFLTGEHVNRRSQVKPLHKFDLRKGKRGMGAIELEARYSQLTLGREVFTNGLADANLWANSAYTIDIGLNWYLNEYVKIYLDWQHSEFNQPVTFAPGRFQRTSDLFWIKGQVYF